MYHQKWTVEFEDEFISPFWGLRNSTSYLSPPLLNCPLSYQKLRNLTNKKVEKFKFLIETTPFLVEIAENYTKTPYSILKHILHPLVRFHKPYHLRSPHRRRCQDPRGANFVILWGSTKSRVGSKNSASSLYNHA